MNPALIVLASLLQIPRADSYATEESLREAIAQRMTPLVEFHRSVGDALPGAKTDEERLKAVLKLVTDSEAIRRKVLDSLPAAERPSRLDMSATDLVADMAKRLTDAEKKAVDMEANHAKALKAAEDARDAATKKAADMEAEAGKKAEKEGLEKMDGLCRALNVQRKDGAGADRPLAQVRLDAANAYLKREGLDALPADASAERVDSILLLAGKALERASASSRYDSWSNAAPSATPGANPNRGDSEPKDRKDGDKPTSFRSRAAKTRKES